MSARHSAPETNPRYAVGARPCERPTGVPGPGAQDEVHRGPQGPVEEPAAQERRGAPAEEGDRDTGPPEAPAYSQVRGGLDCRRVRLLFARAPCRIGSDL
ncbi:hypothetical protein THAOC_05054 [Thalassiosira oceanica]|uniref:Uncharacterized protein n=1 Tax=Thalassiosira oceanica TaxID=159749 RepID=K0T897_THAOC|nr:hypothetical protein THAOC_05054 [Thalassiosira oceanica]|eukprot:EJK73329.1 hypothetical protein THAOC_05054 [Thalassiosira oceanica]